MITEYIRYKLTSHSLEDLVSAYAKAADHLKAAPECHGFDLAQCQDEPNCLTLRILWASTSGHLEGFRKGPHFPPFLALIRPFISEIDEMRHYSPTDVVWTRDGV